MAKPAVSELDRHIGKRLRKLRQHHKISAEKLADALNTTQQQISRYENGNNKLGASQLYNLANCLNTPISWFYLDYEPDAPVAALQEATPVYETGRVQEELDIIATSWPQLSAGERDILLRLLDTFMLQDRH